MQNKLSDIKKWLNKPYEVKKITRYKFSVSSIFLILGTSLSLSAVCYLSKYFEHFDIAYFQHFSAVDLISVLYSFFEIFYTLSVIAVALISFLAVPYVASQLDEWISGRSRPANKTIIICSFISAWVTTFFLETFIRNNFQISSLINVPLLIIMFVVVFGSVFKSLKIIGLLLVFLPSFFQQKGTLDAISIESNPVKFNVTIADDGTKETLTFDGDSLLFIYKTDKSLYYQDIRQKRVSIIPVSRIMETSFSVR